MIDTLRRHVSVFLKYNNRSSDRVLILSEEMDRTDRRLPLIDGEHEKTQRFENFYSVSFLLSKRNISRLLRCTRAMHISKTTVTNTK